MTKKINGNNDTLITFGEDALTMRKDDPRTQEYKNKLADERLEKMKEDGKDDLWAGISLSNARQDNETFEAYQDRRKTIKELEKLYKLLGREECKKQYPNGFAYALHIALGNKKEDVRDFMKNEKEKLKGPQFTATMTNEDGTTQEMPVQINNDKK